MAGAEIPVNDRMQSGCSYRLGAPMGQGFDPAFWHVQQVKAHCGPGELFCRPRRRQALLQWARDSRRI